MDTTVDTTTALIVGSVTLFIYLVCWSMKRPYKFPPGPLAWPIVGSAAQIPTDDGIEFYNTMSNWVKKYGPVYSMSFGKKWIVVINDFSTMREAMVKNSMVARWIINGGYSQQWKLQRNTALQVLRSLGYGRDIIQNVITEEAETMIETFKSKPDEGIDIQDHLSNAVSNVMTSLLFGQRYNYEDEELKVLRHTVDELLAVMDESFILDHLPGASILPEMMKIKAKANKVSAKYVDLIVNKISQIPAWDAPESEPTNFVEGYRMERKKNTNIENRLFQLTSDFILAGFETTNTALGWGVWFMLEYPEIQEKVHQEIDKVTGRNRKPRLGDKEAMPYVEATLLETLRLGRVVPLTLPHETLDDVTVGDYTIPKGSEVWGNLWHILMDPNTWPEPEVFKPERFIDVDGKVIKREELVNFGLGRRACLGEQLARQELFLFFVHLLNEFNIVSPKGVELPKRIGRVAGTHQPPVFKATFRSRD